jgi:hypothetical protein
MLGKDKLPPTTAMTTFISTDILMPSLLLPHGVGRCEEHRARAAWLNLTLTYAKGWTNPSLRCVMSMKSSVILLLCLVVCACGGYEQAGDQMTCVTRSSDESVQSVL